jgi:soluble lytic murein transglycosylase
MSDVNAVAAPGQGVPAALIWSIMREESGYRPDVVSPAGARGLLQIMPATGARLAREAQLDRFDPEDLFEPSLNVRLGAFYLGALMRRFEGRASAAIGSYNAGPEAVARWLARTGSLPDDEWVEGIPYEQTRGYVKRVLRSVCAYELLP